MFTAEHNTVVYDQLISEDKVDLNEQGVEHMDSLIWASRHDNQLLVDVFGTVSATREFFPSTHTTMTLHLYKRIIIRGKRFGALAKAFFRMLLIGLWSDSTSTI